MKNTACSELVVELNQKRQKVRSTILLFVFYIACHIINLNFKLGVSSFDFSVLGSALVLIFTLFYLEDEIEQLMVYRLYWDKFVYYSYCSIIVVSRLFLLFLVVYRFIVW